MIDVDLFGGSIRRIERSLSRIPSSRRQILGGRPDSPFHQVTALLLECPAICPGMGPQLELKPFMRFSLRNKRGRCGGAAIARWIQITSPVSGFWKYQP